VRDEIRAEIALKEEANRQKMMVEASEKLAYAKTMREQAEKTPSSSDKEKASTIEFFDSKIRELEIDARGEARYLYNLRYATDFGREANGVKPEFAKTTITSSHGVSLFIRQLIVEDDSLYLPVDEYKIPSGESIEKQFETENKRIIEIDINLYEEESESDKVPILTLYRERINY